MLDVQGPRQAVGEAGEIGGSPNAFQFARLQLLVERDQVDRLGEVHQLDHLLRHPAVPSR